MPQVVAIYYETAADFDRVVFALMLEGHDFRVKPVPVGEFEGKALPVDFVVGPPEVLEVYAERGIYEPPRPDA